jgi:hypothetical protein
MNGGRPVRVTAKLRSELNAARSARSARRKGETTALAAKEMEQAGPVPYHVARVRRARELALRFNVETIQYHRNGITGEPFHVVLFRASDGMQMVGIVFEERKHIAVLNVTQLAEGDIESATNSWRGDQYEQALRDEIAEWWSKPRPKCETE